MAGDGMFGAIASGAGSGAGMGASIGSLVPGVGTAVGAGIGALAGGITSGIKQNQSNQAQELPVVDPMERARLAQLAQQRKNLSSGTDVLTQQNIQQQQNIGKAAQTALARSTGGDVGQTMSALLQSQKATQGGVNQAVAQTQNRIPYFDNAQGGLLSRISDRKIQLARLMRDQRVAENAQARTDANVNTQALLATEGGTQTIPEGMTQAGQAAAVGARNLVSGIKGMFNQPQQASPTLVQPQVTGALAGGMSTAQDPSQVGQVIPQAIQNLPILPSFL